MSLFCRSKISTFLFPFILSATLFLAGQECFAQEEHPELAKTQEISTQLFTNGGWWGTGGYFSPIKLPLYILLFLTWAGCASWINCDQERLKKEKRENFNLSYLLLYGVGGTGVFFIPVFWLAFSATVLMCLVPALTYIVIRNQPLPPGDRVLTGEHLWFLFAVGMGKIGITIKHEQRHDYDSGPPLDIHPVVQGGDPQAAQARLILARNAPGYNLLRENLYDAVQSRATALRFDFSPEQTKIWHHVDGTWLELLPVPHTLGRTREKDIYEEMMEAAKKIVGGNHEDRRSKQSGTFKMVIGKSKKKNKQKKYDVEFMSQGTPTGEAAMFQLHAKIVPFKTLDEIGLRSEMQPKVLEQINGKKGIVLLAAPPANGLRSSLAVFSKVCDRFTRDVANVEDINSATETIENVMAGHYDSAKGETPMKVLPDLLFRSVTLLFVRDMSSAETVKTCCESLEHEDRLFITMVRSKDSVDSLLRFLSVDYPAEQIVPHLNAVISQRLIRLLCPDCKEAYTPDPKVLQQLRLNPQHVQQLYRKRTPLSTPHEEAKRGICPKCHGVGFYGRTALFELLTVSDAVKALLLSRADAGAVRQQCNKEGQQTFFHEGVRLLLKGEASVDELSRVLKM